MKNFHKALSILAAAALFAGCSSYDETNDPARAGNTSVKLLADVADDAETRAGISVGESTFTGYWEENDAMGILFTAPGSTPELRPFTTNNNNDFAFEGELPAQSGAWQYMAFYPHATVNGTKASIPFGNLRTQSGNAFNCASDALAAPILSFANAEPGKTDEGDPVRFTLNRLTSILNLEVKGGDNADKVRYLLLTSENETQTLSAASIDFDISDMGSGLAFSQTAPSNLIALGFEQGTAPDANDINAFFNIMPGSYDKLTVDVITAPRIGTVAIERGADKPFAAGKLYKRAETPVFAPLEAPSFDWPGHEIDQAHEITVDDNNQLTYSAAINIHVPGGIAGLEVNISCPNVKQGGMAFGVTAKGAEEVVKAVRSVYKKTLIVKLSPNVTDITEIARAAENGGADSVSLINTLLGMAIDAERRRPILSTVTGGMSGAAVKPIALRMVWQVAKAVKIPVIGLGGIMNWKDAVEFMLAGASAIQIGTANFIDPAVTVKVVEGINDYLDRHGYQSIKDIIGALEV